MPTGLLTFAIFVLAGVLFLVGGLSVLARRGLASLAGRGILIYNILGLAASTAVLWSRLQPQIFLASFITQLPAFVSLLLVPVFILIGRRALHNQRSIWPLLLLWLLWVGGMLFFTPGLIAIDLPEASRPELAGISGFTGWVVMLGLATLELIRVNHQPASILVRKRAQLWLLAWLPTALGSGLLLIGQAPWGLLAAGLGASLARI